MNGEVRGAAAAAPRATPLTMVSRAVAGDGLERVASSASEALGCAVAIALRSGGEPVICPRSARTPSLVHELTELAHSGASAEGNRLITEAVPVRIGEEVVGLVASIGRSSRQAELPSWLEGAAAAATVTVLIDSSRRRGPARSQRALLLELSTGRPVDLDRFVAEARELGVDLAAGATAICACQTDGAVEPPSDSAALLADDGNGRVLALHPTEEGALTLAAQLRSHGMAVGVSAPRREPSALRDALREAKLLAELADLLIGHEETYRLLIGIAIRDPAELERLRARTIATVLAYDSEHHTELLETLRAFLLHHGSTTETAEALRLHRHTVGYRLTRVHEVSDLSPHESDGRERLSLGLKAHEILEASKRLSK